MLDRPATLSPETPVAEAPAQPPTIEVAAGTRLWHMQRALILATLSHLAGDKRLAARTLGISLKTLYNRLGTYGDEGWVRRRMATASPAAVSGAQSAGNAARTTRF